MYKYLLAALLFATPAVAQEACEGTMKPLAEVRANGLTVDELTPHQRANVEANIRVRVPELPDLTHVYILSREDMKIMVLVTGKDCIAHAGQIDDENIARLEKEPAGA